MNDEVKETPQGHEGEAEQAFPVPVALSARDRVRLEYQIEKQAKKRDRLLKKFGGVGAARVHEIAPAQIFRDTRGRLYGWNMTSGRLTRLYETPTKPIAKTITQDGRIAP